VELIQTPEDKSVARSVFKFSISYMMLLCLGLIVDSFPVTQSLMLHVTQPIQALIAEIPMFQ
jgi:heme o synthase